MSGKAKGKAQESSDSQPFAITTPRRVSIPLLEIVRNELQQMEDLGVIRKVEKPTDWCAGMVVVAKTKGVPEEKQKVRICVDLTKLNESVQREKHELPSVNQSGSALRLAGAKVFTKARCQFRVLANTSLAQFRRTYHVHHSIREVLLSKATFWDHLTT